MRDRVVKVLRVDKDTVKGHWALHSVYFEDIPEQRVIMNDDALALTMFEDEMLSAGISAEMIVKHRELSAQYMKDEIDREYDSY